MSRAFTSDDVFQHDTGTTAGTLAPNITASLPNPATEGNGGLMIVATNGFVTVPENWHLAAPVISAGAIPMAIMCRADLAAGDQSWLFDSVGADSNFVWLAEEWTNLSYAPMEGNAMTALGFSPASISTATTGTFDASFVVGIACVVLVVGGGTGPAWPTITSWTNGFVETDTVEAGNGSAAAHMKIWVARRYGTEGETGGWETTATFSSTQTSRTAHAAIAVFRAESFEGEA